MENTNNADLSRRHFIQKLGMGAAAMGAFSMTTASAADELPRDANGNIIPGFGKEDSEIPKHLLETSGEWESKSDRKIRVGIAGYGLCKFGGAFFYQTHPNVEVVAATDLDSGRCAARARTA